MLYEVITDFVEAGYFFDVGDEFIAEVAFNGVDKGGFLIGYKICVIAASSGCNVTVKVSYIPVNDSNPVNSIF